MKEIQHHYKKDVIIAHTFGKHTKKMDNTDRFQGIGQKDYLLRTETGKHQLYMAHGHIIGRD